MDTKCKTIGGKDYRTHDRAASALSLDQRMAFSLREVAEVIGISYSSIYRLHQRGLLHSTPGLRRKIISKEELLRFLRN